MCINTIRAFCADMVQKANSGHPGAPMGMAPIAHMLWSQVMSYAPHNPSWPNRDRFVLSNGHACTLLYCMLHLSGYNLSLADCQRFRQLGSKTPGHPEIHVTEGVEVTTGPLGQGIANGVGMAIAESHLAATFNKPGLTVVDHYTYVFCGDGDMQEGLSSEACSLAGHLGLGKLILIYDDNSITIDGETKLSFSENVPMRFRAYNWHTTTVYDGDHNLSGLLKAIEEAKSVTGRPSLIAVKTTIGFGATKQGTGAVHGAPLKDDLPVMKKKLGMDPKKMFFVPADVQDRYSQYKKRGQHLEKKWKSVMETYRIEYPQESEDLDRRFRGALPVGWKSALPKYKHGDKKNATRSLSGEVLNALAGAIPNFIGGSADLTPSNKTALSCTHDYQKATPDGRYLRFGVREHAMAAIGNGISAHGGLIPFTATFFNFIEYMFPAVRLAAISHHQQVFVMTHDSIMLGEDGPTHQPIEAINLCRATPNLITIRPADGKEVVGAYMVAMTNHAGPTVLCLSRQGLPHLTNSSENAVFKGGYIVHGASIKPDLVFVATGSEVSLAIDASKRLNIIDNLKVRVVSMPSTELFDQQSVQYRLSILPSGVPIISIEAASTLGWARYAHFSIGISTFGHSGPLKDVARHCGFTVPKVCETTRRFLSHLEKRMKQLGTQSIPLLNIHLSGKL